VTADRPLAVVVIVRTARKSPPASAARPSCESLRLTVFAAWEEIANRAAPSRRYVLRAYFAARAILASVSVSAPVIGKPFALASLTETRPLALTSPPA
jgi:hypothetical protein